MSVFLNFFAVIDFFHIPRAENRDIINHPKYKLLCFRCGRRCGFTTKSEVFTMKKYVCDVCGWVYDEAENDVKFEDLAEDFECPLCGVGKDQFSEE